MTTNYNAPKVPRAGVWCFTLLSEARAYQRKAQKLGFRTKLRHYLGRPFPYRELTITVR